MVRPALTALGRIGRYEIYDELAEGGMARVFLAHRHGSKQLCVLKQLHGNLEEHRTASIRFQREAHLVSQLDHPNIARVIDAGLEDGKFCIAMELIEGCTVQEVIDILELRNQLLPRSLTLTIASEVLSGLAYAHTLRGADGRHLEIVHRDLSPRNVMVTYDGRVKIIDFGVAQGRIDSFRTAPGMIIGTLHYMSPEQALTERTDHRSDLYSLSIVLWELLSGEMAVRDGKAVEVLEQVIEEKPPPLHTVDPTIPRALSDVIAYGLAKDPKDRWQTAAEYRESLLAAGRPLGNMTTAQMGGFVRSLFPPEKQAYAGWLKVVALQNEGPPEAPTIADGSLEAYDLLDTATAPPHPSLHSTQPDMTPPVEITPGNDVTRTDISIKEMQALMKLQDQDVRLRHLEKTLQQQRRMLISMTVLIFVMTSLIVSNWWFV